jgi:putative tryptophan/tyrosine transport system substrate-binding protein
MNRREFIALLGATAVTWSLASRAQQGERVRRIGVLSSASESDPDQQLMMTAFQNALRELGWIDGRNLRIDRRWAAGQEARFEAFAKELITLKPDVLVAYGTPATAEFQKETGSIPIVFVQVSDPIGAGLIANLAHPGGNITGFTNFESSMAGKWVEILKEIAPGVGQVALLFNPQTAPFVPRYYQGALETTARSFGIEPRARPVHDARQLESAVTALAREPNGGLIVMPDSFNVIHRERIIELAAVGKLPAIYPYGFASREGGLISYGNDQIDLFQRAATYVNRILKGVNPADLPVQAPVKFELSINLKTAKALGLTVPPTLLATANEVIE